MNGLHAPNADLLGKSGPRKAGGARNVICKLHANHYVQVGHEWQAKTVRVGHGLSGYGMSLCQNLIAKKDAPMNRIREIRKSKDLSMRGLADLVGCEPSTISKLEKDQRRLTDKWLRRLAAALHCSEQELLGGSGMVRVVGRVGAGQKMFPYDDLETGDGLREVPPPFGMNADSICAAEVCGPSMYPFIKEGWLLFYRKTHEGVLEEEIGALCVCATEDGARYIKELRRGSEPGRFTLWSWNAPAMENVRLAWAAKVLDIRPS